MKSYAFWNNKGGVGKTFLCFVAAAEYAHRHPDVDVYVIDLCPQANVSETLLGGRLKGAKALEKLLSKSPRASIAGYLEARLNSPFQKVADVNPFVVRPHKSNSNIPENLLLIPGDNLVELLAEPIRQASQLSVPTTAWRQVMSWIKDLTVSLRDLSGDRDAIFVIDCNPSFSIYTQLALVAADSVIVPFTADDSSRRGIENVVALLYGAGSKVVHAYSRINFSKRAKEEGLDIPGLHLFVSNRVTQYEGSASKAFKAAIKPIRSTISRLHTTNRNIFSNPAADPKRHGFVEVPDYHSACIVAATTSTPIHALKAGPKKIGGERIQINAEPLRRYKKALGKFVDALL